MVESKVNLGVSIGSVLLKNPVMPASGCFAHEYADAMDLARLGALVTKSVTPKRRIGNPVPRVAERVALERHRLARARVHEAQRTRMSDTIFADYSTAKAVALA